MVEHPRKNKKAGLPLPNAPFKTQRPFQAILFVLGHTLIDFWIQNMDIDGDGGRRDLRMKDKPHQLRRLSIRWWSSSERRVALPPADSAPPLGVGLSGLSAPALLGEAGTEVRSGGRGAGLLSPGETA